MFQEKIKHLRLEHDMSQEDLAEVLNVTRQSISKYENGTAEPSYDKLAILVDYFGVSYDDLLADNTLVETKSTQNKKQAESVSKPKKVKKEPTIEVISVLDDEAESQFVAFTIVEKPAYFELEHKPHALLQGIPAKGNSIFKPKNVDLAWYRTVNEAKKEERAATAALKDGKKMYHLEHYVPVKKHGFFSVQIDDESSK